MTMLDSYLTASPSALSQLPCLATAERHWAFPPRLHSQLMCVHVGCSDSLPSRSGDFWQT
jgi:hypothetical protein